MSLNMPLLLRLGGHLLSGRRVGGHEIAEAYDAVAPTYQRWTGVMAEPLDHLIDAPWLQAKQRRVLDLAGGTGALAERILGAAPETTLEAVDISPAMAERYRQAFPAVPVTVMDGLTFLQQRGQKYDAIFCGWALPYFNQRSLLKAIVQRLEPGGHLGLVANCQATLAGVKEAVLAVMARHRQRVSRICTIGSRLPRDAAQLTSWCTKAGFHRIDDGSGKTIRRFEDPADCLNWLLETGALAGIPQIFNDFSAVRGDLVDELDKRLCRGQEVKVNHSFVYGRYCRT